MMIDKDPKYDAAISSIDEFQLAYEVMRDACEKVGIDVGAELDSHMYSIKATSNPRNS